MIKKNLWVSFYFLGTLLSLSPKSWSYENLFSEFPEKPPMRATFSSPRDYEQTLKKYFFNLSLDAFEGWDLRAKQLESKKRQLKANLESLVSGYDAEFQRIAQKLRETALVYEVLLGQEDPSFTQSLETPYDVPKLEITLSLSPQEIDSIHALNPSQAGEKLIHLSSKKLSSDDQQRIKELFSQSGQKKLVYYIVVKEPDSPSHS